MENKTNSFSQEDRTTYHLSLKINTDGDFGWDLVPVGFNYDFSTGEFCLEKEFSSFHYAKDYIEHIVAVLLEGVRGRDYAVQSFQNMMDHLRSSVLQDQEFYDECDDNWTWEVSFSKTYTLTSEEQLAVAMLKQAFSQGKVDSSDIIDMLNHCE